MTLHVVMGEFGEYSDRNEWLVAAYADPALAQTHCALADSWRPTRESKRNPYDDTEMKCRYYVTSVELREAVPQVEVLA